MHRKIRIVLEYEGSRYSGWQIQAQGEATIQTEVESAIEKTTGEKLRVHGAGRTDAGVHALGQVAHFTSESELTAEKLKNAINAHLPQDIAVIRADEVPMSFDSRRDSLGKIYRYEILNRPVRGPLLLRTAHHIKTPLDVPAMNIAAGYLIGEHDFKSFQASGCSAKHPVRRIYKLDVLRAEPERIAVEIFATAFLKQMVRNIVGTLLLVGNGKLGPDEMESILKARDRGSAGPTAPAKGLTLVKVFYEDDPPGLETPTDPTF